MITACRHPRKANANELLALRIQCIPRSTVTAHEDPLSVVSGFSKAIERTIARPCTGSDAYLPICAADIIPLTTCSTRKADKPRRHR
jgi:hypothetical protein